MSAHAPVASGPGRPAGVLRQEALQLAETLREDARRQVDRLVDDHADRLRQWTEAALQSLGAAAESPTGSREVKPQERGSTQLVVRPAPAASMVSARPPSRGGPPVLEGDGVVAMPGEVTAGMSIADVHDEEHRGAIPSVADLRQAALARSSVEMLSGSPPPSGRGSAGVKRIAFQDGSQTTARKGKTWQEQVARSSLVSMMTNGDFPSAAAGLRRISVASAFDDKLLNVRGSGNWKASDGRRKSVTSLTAREARVIAAEDANKTTKMAADLGDVFQFREEEVFENPPQNCIQAMVRSSAFDQFMGGVLLVSALVIAVKVDYMARQQTTDVPVPFLVLDWLFCSAFVAELALRFAASPKAFCSGKDRTWNVFDLIVVSMQVCDEVMQLAFRGSGSDALDKVSFMRIFRLARLVRFLRMVRLLSGLKSMVYLLMASMTSFLWAFAMLLFLMVMMAVYFTEMYSTLTSSSEDSASREAMGVFWGSVPTSTLSLFMAIFGGFDWKDGLESMKLEGEDGTYILNALVLCFYVAFTTLVMLNLVTGVFVDGAQRIVKEDHDKDLLRLAAHLFNCADENGDDQLEEDEFKTILESDLMLGFCDANSISVNEVEVLYDLLKEPDEMGVPVTEFIRACKLLQGEARAADLQTVKLLCKTFFEQVDSQLKRIELCMDGRKVSPGTLHMNVPPSLMNGLKNLPDVDNDECY